MLSFVSADGAIMPSIWELPFSWLSLCLPGLQQNQSHYFVFRQICLSSLITYLIHQIWLKYWFWLFPTKFFHFEDIQTKILISLKTLAKKSRQFTLKKIHVWLPLQLYNSHRMLLTDFVSSSPCRFICWRLNPRFGRWLGSDEDGALKMDWYLIQRRKDIKSLCLFIPASCVLTKERPQEDTWRDGSL